MSILSILGYWAYTESDGSKQQLVKGCQGACNTAVRVIFWQWDMRGDVKILITKDHFWPCVYIFRLQSCTHFSYLSVIFLCCCFSSKLKVARYGSPPLPLSSPQPTEMGQIEWLIQQVSWASGTSFWISHYTTHTYLGVSLALMGLIVYLCSQA